MCQAHVFPQQAQYLDAARSKKAVSFLDRTTIPLVAAVADKSPPGPIIAICDEPLNAEALTGWKESEALGGDLTGIFNVRDQEGAPLPVKPWLESLR